MDWFLFSWPTLILLGVALRMALRLTYGTRGPEPGDPVYVFLMIASWVLIALGVMPAIVGAVLGLHWIAILLIAAVVALLASATIVEAVIQRRIAQRRSICRMLALLVEHGGQLESSVLTAGQSMRGIVGRAANRLFASLRSGTPLGVALNHHAAALPGQAAAYLGAGSTRRARLAALRDLSRSDQGEVAAIWRACVDRIAYLGLVLVVMAMVLTFIMIKIVPAYVTVFDEFSIELPAMTHLAIALSEFVVQYFAGPVILVFVLMTLATIVVGIFYLCDVPVIGWISDLFFRGKRNADVLRILALATEHRQPLADALYRVSRVYPSERIRRRLRSVVAAVVEGTDWRDALLTAGVVTKGEHGLLHTADPVGNLSWALREIAKRREKRTVYRLALGLQVLYPLAILLIGAFVGFLVISLFVPIVQIIQGLA